MIGMTEQWLMRLGRKLHLRPFGRLASVGLFLMVGAVGAAQHQPPKSGDTLPNGEQTANPIYKSSYRIINVHTHAPFPSQATVRAELEYFETDHVGLIVPFGEWKRLTGVKLPPEVLEKFYHANAERLIPGLNSH